MRQKIYEKLKDAILSIVPVMLIMLIISFILGFNIVTIISILISTILLIVGIGLFTFGADLSMIEIGKIISSELLKTRKMNIIILVTFVVGIVITIAEPDLKVLASQMSAIDSGVLILSVSLGVGIFLSIAVARIIYQIPLKKILCHFYLLLLFLIVVSSEEIVPVAFDSGGVTTGPMSVPFILAMGIGISSLISGRGNNDSFGLVSLCSIGPIITVLLLGMFSSGDMSYTYNISEELTTFSSLVSCYFNEIIPVFSDVLISLLPIVVVFLIFSFITKKLKSRQFHKVVFGLPITIIGLTLFFIGVTVGYLPVAYLIGINTYSKLKILLIPLGLIIGFVIVKAEPAVAVLTEQIEKITEGSIKKNIMNTAIAIGVAIAVAVSIIRVLTGIPITYILFFGYILSLVLMMFSPNMFTMVAFDSGGAVTGPMTTSFLLPFIIGICYASGVDVLTQGFGLVALVALSPLITIQILGIIYKVKSSKKNIVDKIDETIIEIERSV